MKQASIKRSRGRNAQPRRGGMFIVGEPQKRSSSVGAAWKQWMQPFQGCSGFGHRTQGSSRTRNPGLSYGIPLGFSACVSVFFLLALLLLPRALSAADAEAEQLKSRAYELYEQKRFDQAAETFQRYLERNPADVKAGLDYASLLSQLNRHDDAAKLLETLHQKNPQNEAAYFKLGTEYVTLKRPGDAEKIFTQLERSANRDLANAAAEANRRLKADLAREERFKAEERVFTLASQFKHEEVLQAIADLEKQAPLSFALEMQRLYSLHSLHQYADALERANKLAVANPKATDLGLLRADLLAQLGRFLEARVIWREIENQNAGTAAAAEAHKRLEAEAQRDAEEKIFELARQQKDREVTSAIDDLEKKYQVSFPLEMQRLYSMQRLHQYKQALKRADALAATHPKDAELALLRADLLAATGKWSEAEPLLTQIARDNAGTRIAFEAEERLKAEEARRTRNRIEENIFNLARQQKYLETVAAIDALEKKGALPWIFEMQRLYALQSLGETERALKRADQLTAGNPEAKDLALLRAYLLAKADRRPEAAKILRQLEKDNPGTALAAEANKQLQAFAAPAAPPPPEARIYELANRRQYREVVAAIDDLEKQGKLSSAMGLQRLYALQALGETARAAQEAEKLSAAYPESTELTLIHADLLIHDHKWDEASKILQQIKKDNANTPVASEAQRRLDSIPAIANLDKWYWGEAYLSGDYLGRFGTEVGSGVIRHGYFIPKARWLQPYAEMRFTVDTRSGVGAQRSIIADNFVGLSLGVRAQPLPGEYFFFYAQGGLNKDLLGRRHDGDWADDYQVGTYGFKSWGPGTKLLSSAPGEEISTTGNIPSTSIEGGSVRSSRTNLFWRGDWFTDVGGDFSYYNRFSSWIGYGQSHQGFRLFQLTPRSAIDAYAVENVSWDVRGNYFDNLFEIGPGARWLWVPHRGWEIILRTEWLQGFYFGRDDLHTRHNTPGQYDDVRIGLSVGLRW